MKGRVAAAFMLVGVLWGSAWMLSPSLPRPAMLAGAVRFASSAALLGVAAAFMRSRNRGIESHREDTSITPSLILGVTLVGLPFALAVWAKSLASAGNVAVLYAAMPLFTALLGDNSDEVSAAIPVVMIGMGGVAFLVAQGIRYSMRQLGGVLLLGLAVALEAWSLNYAKRRIRRGNILTSSAIQCSIAAALLLLLGGARGMSLPVRWKVDSVASLTVLSLAEGVVSLPLLLWLLSRIEAWKVASLQWAATVIAVAEASLILHGEPTLLMMLGAVMVLVAVIWLLKSCGAPESATGVVTLQITSMTESPTEPSKTARD